MPLLGNAEKGELERLILARLTDHYERNGSSALLIEGLRVVVNVDGVEIDAGQTPDPLAAVVLLQPAATSEMASSPPRASTVTNLMRTFFNGIPFGINRYGLSN